jgi:hypothetical protein
MVRLKGAGHAAAMAIAALCAKPEDLLLFCPSDHHIPDAAAFAQVVKQGVALHRLVPSSPSVSRPPSPAPLTATFCQGKARADGAFNVKALQKSLPKTRPRPCCFQAARFGTPVSFCALPKPCCSALGNTRQTFCKPASMLCNHPETTAALCARSSKHLNPAAQKALTTPSWSTTPTWPCSLSPALGATWAVGTLWQTHLC